jgi:hypothetical protein
MPYRWFATVLFALATLTTTHIAAAQTLSADEKEMASYRLTMPNVKKAAAVIQSVSEEAAKDPKVQELTRLKAQIEALEKKDELTEAEEKQLEKLRNQSGSLEEEIENASPAGSMTGNKTLAEMEAAIGKHPQATRALAREGLSAHDFALTLMTLFQAAMVEGFSQGKVDMAKLPAGVNPENIQFVREHKAELEALQRAMSPEKK